MGDEGIFRLSGDRARLEQMKQEIDQVKKSNGLIFKFQGGRIDFSKEKDMNNVTGIIKLYLQQLPVPLCTYDLYAQFLSVGKSKLKDWYESNGHQI